VDDGKVIGVLLVLLGIVAGYWLWRGGILPGITLFVLIGVYVFLIVSLHKRQAWA
jgi:hypothetical protein